MNKTEVEFMAAVAPLRVLARAERGMDTLLPSEMTIDPLGSARRELSGFRLLFYSIIRR